MRDKPAQQSVDPHKAPILDERSTQKEKLRQKPLVDADVSDTLERLSTEKLRAISESKPMLEELYYCIFAALYQIALRCVTSYEKVLAEYLEHLEKKADLNIETDKATAQLSMQGKDLIEEYDVTYRTYTKNTSKNAKLMQVS